LPLDFARALGQNHQLGRYGKIELYRLLVRSKSVSSITHSGFYDAETEVNLLCIFETTAVRCFLLTDLCDEIEEPFDVVGKSKLIASRKLADKVRFYLKNDTERMNIAKRGHE
jgi:spore maturation protein CgeB